MANKTDKAYEKEVRFWMGNGKRSRKEAEQMVADYYESMMEPFEDDSEYEEMRNPRRPVGVLVK